MNERTVRERFFHGTSLDAAQAILAGGFRLDVPHTHDVGDFGLGVYLTRELTRARTYGHVVLAVEPDVLRCARIANPYFLDGSRSVKPRTAVEQMFFRIAFDSGRMRTCGQHVQAAARACVARELRDAFLGAGYTGIVTGRPDGETVIFDPTAIRAIEIFE